MALIHLYDTITSAIDRKEFTVGIAIDWIKYYFCHILQYVQYNDSYSTSNTIQYGVPHDSIFGRLLFLLCINDLSNVSNIFDFYVTNLFYSHKDSSCLINLINDEMSKLSEWFKANMLSINIKKSNYMIFKPRQITLIC